MRVVSTIKEVREQIMEWKQQGYEEIGRASCRERV